MLLSNKILTFLAIATIISTTILTGCAKQEGVHISVKRQRGMASWYGPGFHGRKTASGERYNQNEMTAAHKKLPFGTNVKVVNMNNMKSVVLRINDRGPYIRGRIIDVSRAAAKELDMLGSGTTKVLLFYLPKEEAVAEGVGETKVGEREAL